ncbi:MAG: PAS domain S-box protein [Dehalococcoidia bacterium]
MLQGKRNKEIASDLGTCAENDHHDPKADALTDRKRVDKTAEQHEQEIRALLEAIPDLVFRLSKDGVFLGFAPAKGQEPALPPAGFLGKNVREVLPTEIALQTIHHMERVLRTGDTQTFEYRLPVPLPDGDLRDYEARLVVSGQDEVLVISRDITECRRAEEALAAETQEHIDITNLTGDIIVKIDKDGRFTFLNDAACQFYGGRREELLGVQFAGYVHPEDMASSVAQVIQEVIESKQLARGFVTRQITPMGTRIVEWNGHALFDEEGQYAGLQGTGRDITERKRAEEALRESEQRFRDIATSVSEWIAEVNREGTYAYSNPMVEEILGYLPEEVVGRGVLDFLYPDERERSIRLFQASLSKKEGLRGFLTRMVHRDGSVRDVEVSAIPLFDERGNVVGLRGITRDVTERKRAEEALRLQSEIMQNMAEAVYLIRASDGVIVYTNPAFERLFGYGPGEMVGKHVSVVNAPTDKSPEETAKEITAALDRTGAWRGEILNIKKDGTLFWCYANVSTFDHPGHGRVWVTYHTDITERKQAEEALRESDQRSREVLEASRDMVYKLNVEAHKFEYVSPAVQPLTGFTPQEFVSMGFDEVTARIHPQDQPEFRTRAEELPACLGEARAGSAIEYRWQRKDGKYRWLSNSWVLLRDDNGQPAAIVGTVRDITNRKRTEEALQRGREDLETRVEARMDGGNTYGLTFRELTVLHLVATGNADKEIAVGLGIRPRTVNKHLENILHKMGADSRTEAGVRALKEGLLG